MTHRPTRERDAAQARQAILAAAEEAFADKGYSGARIDQIAERAGYNKSLIFQYFEHKLGLYRAVIECTRGDVEQEMTQSVFGVIDDFEPLDSTRVRAFIQQAVSASFDFLVRRPNLRRILAWEAAEGWQTYRSLYAVHTSMQHKAARAIAFVQRAQTAGFIRTDLDPLLIFVLVLSFAQCYLTSLPRFTAIFPEHDFASTEALDAARAELVRLVHYGILTSTALGATTTCD